MITKSKLTKLKNCKKQLTNLKWPELSSKKLNPKEALEVFRWLKKLVLRFHKLNHHLVKAFQCNLVLNRLLYPMQNQVHFQMDLKWVNKLLPHKHHLEDSRWANKLQPHKQLSEDLKWDNLQISLHHHPHLLVDLKWASSHQLLNHRSVDLKWASNHQYNLQA